MNKQRWILGLLSTLALMLLVSPSEANFVQCPGAANCGAPEGVTEQSDVINGTPFQDGIDGLGGDDLIFGGDDADPINAGSGHDFILGGLGSDLIDGGSDDDIILPGPDNPNNLQEADGDFGNDIFIVLAGEVAGCLFIYGEEDHDVVNLIGFGPFSVTSPLDIPNFVEGYVQIDDPIAGGRIFVEVSPDQAHNTEIINGLPTPFPTFLTDAEFETLTNLINGTDPCPSQTT
jgi:Ca2+-binding RTX toxin-like protein